MGRPKAVNIKTFPQYNILHTEKIKMYSGVSMTALYPLKETKEWYRSIEVWASYASTFKRKKKNLTPSVTIPTITDEKTINFLNENAWHDWTSKEKKNDDMKETLEMLDKLFPNHKKVFFYELDSILTQFSWGTFIKYDDNGNVETPDEHDMEKRKYMTHKYNRFVGEDIPEIKAAYEEYKAVDRSDKNNKEQEKLASAKYRIYHDLQADYTYKTNCLDNVFINIGQNAVCYPVAFTHNTAEWSREKYGKLIGYAHAGEILFVVTPDTVYFEIKRHF